MLDKRTRETLQEIYIAYDSLLAWALPTLPPQNISNQSAALTRLRLLLGKDRQDAQQDQKPLHQARKLPRGPQTGTPTEETGEEERHLPGCDYTSSR